MTVTRMALTVEQSRRIDALVETGRFPAASDVVQEGLRLVEEQVAREDEKLQSLKRAVQEGLDDLDSGRFVDCGSSEELQAMMDQLWHEAQDESASSRQAGSI